MATSFYAVLAVIGAGLLITCLIALAILES